MLTDIISVPSLRKKKRASLHSLETPARGTAGMRCIGSPMVTRRSGSGAATRAGAAMRAGAAIDGCGGDAQAAGDCCRPECAAAQRAESTAHGMLECPVAAAVWQWVVDVWEAAAPGAGSGGCASRPLRTAAVLLLGHRSAWDPGGPDVRVRWDVMRLAAIFFHFP